MYAGVKETVHLATGTQKNSMELDPHNRLGRLELATLHTRIVHKRLIGKRGKPPGVPDKLFRARRRVDIPPEIVGEILRHYFLNDDCPRRARVLLMSTTTSTQELFALERAPELCLHTHTLELNPPYPVYFGKVLRHMPNLQRLDISLEYEGGLVHNAHLRRLVHSLRTWATRPIGVRVYGLLSKPKERRHPHIMGFSTSLDEDTSVDKCKAAEILLELAKGWKGTTSNITVFGWLPDKAVLNI
ncbi:hypothetical protein BC629DRAFT_1445769 [Irpex lacteus]|nr:hypothetical protein BC629DRAFT_1445769 [Irpex lacteus]